MITMGLAPTAFADDPYPYQYNMIKEANRAAVNNRTYFRSSQSRRNITPDPEIIILRENGIDKNSLNIPQRSPYDDIVRPLPVEKNTYRLDENIGSFGNE